jgi:hypothetical protein
VCSALAFYAFVFPFTVRTIRAKLDSTGKGIFSGLITLPETLALAALSFLAICFFAYLLAYNVFLVAKNKVHVHTACDFALLLHFASFTHELSEFGYQRANDSNKNSFFLFLENGFSPPG